MANINTIINDLKTKYSITNATTEEALLELLNVVTVDELNLIKTTSVLPLPNVVRNSPDELKKRFVEIVTNESNGITGVINKRMALLKIILDKLSDDKINYADIVDALNDTSTDKPLSAKQGKVLKELIDTLASTIQDGTDIDSFADVETALAGKVDNSEVVYISLGFNSSGTLTEEQMNLIYNSKHCILWAEQHMYYMTLKNSSSVHFYNIDKFDVLGNPYVETDIRFIILNPTTREWTRYVKTYNFYNKNQADTLLALKQDIANLVTSWSETLSNSKYPSEKLVKNYVDSEVSSEATSRQAADALKLNISDIIDGLTDTSTTKALSANQGKVLKGMIDSINTLLESDDTTLDELQEIVTYIKNNKSLIDGITTSKVNVSDIVDNLTSNVDNKPLSAKQGYVLKGLIDAITDIETGYGAQEALRVLAEQARVEAENGRVLAEQAREYYVEGLRDGTDIDSFGDVETALAGIKDGTTIDSFGDVETALALKQDILSGSTSIDITSNVVSVKDSYVEGFFATDSEVQNMLSEVFN